MMNTIRLMVNLEKHLFVISTELIHDWLRTSQLHSDLYNKAMWYVYWTIFSICIIMVCLNSGYVFTTPY